MKKLYLVLALVCSLSLASCTVLQQLTQQMSEMETLTKCEFNLDNISDLSIAGIKLSNVTNGDISVLDVANLAKAFATKSIPLDMNVNIDITNPTMKAAAMNTMDWICEINGKEIVNGVNTEKYTIDANSTAKVPLKVATDIYTLFSEGGLDALKTFVKTLAGNDTDSNIALKIKPSLNIGSTTWQYPDFFTINKKVSGTNSTNTQSNTNSGDTTNPSGNTPNIITL